MREETSQATYMLDRTNACYWDFLQLIQEPMWSAIGPVPHERHCSNVLLRLQVVAKDQMEKQTLKAVFEVAWRDFMDKVMKKHLPHYMPEMEQLAHPVSPYTDAEPGQQK